MKIWKFIRRTVGAIALSVMASSASATSLGLDLVSGGATFNTDSASNLMLGWSFRLSASRTVNGLGYWDEGSNGLLESHQVGIWDSSGALVAAGTVDNGDSVVASAHPDGQWLVDDLAASIVLGAGSYTIGGLSTLSSFDPIRQHLSAISTDSALTFIEARFIRDAGFAEPTDFADSVRYFGPTLLFAVPEPGALALFGISLAGLGLAARRRK